MTLAVSKSVMKHLDKIGIFILFLFVFSSCNSDKKEPVQEQPTEDLQAKQMLEGIWMNEDEGGVAFRVQGDTIFYPDENSQPARFAIYDDTMVVMGGNNVKYPIVKQAAHIFIFHNQSGDEIKLVKSTDPADKFAFSHKPPMALNQGQLIKRDTVVIFNNERYHGYVQINPTTYKVYKSSLNSDGVEVDNIYYDNIIHLSVFNGNRKVFSSDFHKKDFARYVPAAFLKQSVLNDMTFNAVNTEGISYIASIGIPDSQISYLVNVHIGYDGKLKFSIKE